MRSQFADWLDKMQHIADAEKISVQARHYDLLDFYFKSKKTPEDAFEEYKIFLKRWNAITKNGKNTEPLGDIVEKVIEENYVERFEQAHSCKIDKLFWIAGSLEDRRALNEFLEEVDLKAFDELFPTIDYVVYEPTDLVQALIDADKFGFIAEVHTPHHDHFSFDDEWQVIGCSCHGGHCAVGYAYGSTIEELMLSIEKEAETCYQHDIATYKKKKVKKG